MKEEYKEVLKGPRTILLIMIYILGLFGLAILSQLGNHMDVAGPVYLVVLLPFVVPYFLSTNYPKIAGWLLILEGLLPILFFLIIFFKPIPLFDTPSIILIGVNLLLLIPVISGIWMIIEIRKIH